MLEMIAIIGSLLSAIGAGVSLYSITKLRREVQSLESSLASKGGELPPSPDIEDPVGRKIAAQMHEDDEGDDR